jgi:lipopolysaccharide heptosyltransferase II
MPRYIKDRLKQTYLALRKFLLFPFVLLRKTCVPTKEDINKILILRHDRIGDMALSTVIFKALKKNYPAAEIIVLASERNNEVIKNDPYVDEILVFKGLRWFMREIRNKDIDLAIDLFYTYELKQPFLTYISGAKYRVGFEEAGREVFFNIKGPKMYPRRHMIDHMFELIDTLGVDVKEKEPQIYLSNDEIKWAKDLLASKGIKEGDFKIAIHPGAYYPSQRWSAEGFADVTRKLVEKTGIKVILFGDKTEEAILRKIKKNIGRGDIPTFYGVNLRQFIALLSQCNLLLCNNSGALHIACALKIPTVSTMGPTDPILWWPVGENHSVIRKDLSCSPCDLAICKRHYCMKQITTEDIMHAVETEIDRIKKK